MKFFPYICNYVALDTGMCANNRYSSSFRSKKIKRYLCQTDCTVTLR